MEYDVSLKAFVSYVWRQAWSWNGFIQLLGLFSVLAGAAFRLACALLYALFYYCDAVILYFLTDYCGLNPLPATNASASPTGASAT